MILVKKSSKFFCPFLVWWMYRPEDARNLYFLFPHHKTSQYNLHRSSVVETSNVCIATAV